MPFSQLSATDLRTRLRAGELSAVDLMDHTLDRIAQVNGRVNAITSLRPKQDLMREAAAADKGGLLGPLAGIPIAIKDLAAAAGLPFTQGSPLFAGTVADADDLVVRRIRDAGAIIIGKTNTPEFGLGSHTFNPVFGATRNPYDSGRSSGGSSGGAAVALATGMLSLADGSDMMGSLRNPAGWNNVYGFRPTWGRVPPDPEGDMYLHRLSTLGPMARCPQDLALLLDVMSGPDPRYPNLPSVTDTLPLGQTGPLRIGWLSDWGGALPMEPGILDTCEAALNDLAALGHTVDACPVPFSADAMWQSWTTLRSFSVAAGLHDIRDQRAHMKPAALWELDRGSDMTGRQLQQASEVRSDWFRAVMGLFQNWDVLALPTAQCWPFAVDLTYPTDIGGVVMDSYHRWMQVVVPASLIGLPTLAVPAGFGVAGLPMGLQLIGAPGRDALLLALGEAYHQATDWPIRRPPPT